MRRIGEYYYNLDSKLRQPELIGNEADTLQFLREQLSQEGQRELFLVLERSSNEDSPVHWIKKSSADSV